MCRIWRLPMSVIKRLDMVYGHTMLNVPDLV